MRRALIVLCAVLAVVPSLAAANGSRARVWLSDRSPLVVRGTGFKAHERIVVTATAGRRFVRTVNAGAAGAFVVRWNGVVATACAAMAIRAAGNRGSVAMIKVPGVECAPGPTDPGQ